MYRNYREFWPYYVVEHSNAINRKLHFVGTGMALVFAALAATTNVWFFAAVPLVGYAFAWVGHFVIEKNRPATFTHPLWSLRGDFHMFFLMLTGRMNSEIERIKQMKG